MSADWKNCLWGDIATLEYGKSLRDYSGSTGTIPVFGTNGLIGYTDKPLRNQSGVIIGRKGAYRGVHYCSTPFFVIDTAFYLNPKSEELDIKYAYYQLLTQDINGMDSGSAIPSTSREDFYGLEIFLPPLPTQRRIASILTALDDKIELNRRMNETLEGIARAMWAEWFGKYASGEEELPEGWKWRKIGDLCNVNKKTLSPNHSLQWIDYVEISEVNRGEIGNINRYERGTEPSRAKRKIQHGDVILSTVRPDRGAYFLAQFPEETMIVSTGFAVFTAVSVPYCYLYILLTRDEMLDFYGQMADGAAYPAINPSVILERETAIPSDQELAEYQKIAEPIFKNIHQNTLQIGCGSNLMYIHRPFLSISSQN